MATIIEQKPLYDKYPVGQDIIFAVSNSLIVATELNVRFVAEIYISSGFPQGITSNTENLIGTFKTTPNNKGVGIFNLRPVLESYVKSDNLALATAATSIADVHSRYKLNINYKYTPRILHLIDKYSGASNISRWVVVRFKTEHLDQNQYLANGTTPNPNYNTLIQVQNVQSDWNVIFNGYLKSTDELELKNSSYSATPRPVQFGYNLTKFKLTGQSKSFLTNAPTTQYANLEDYGTVGILMTRPVFNADNLSGLSALYFKYYDSSGSLLDEEPIYTIPQNGANDYADRLQAGYQALYAGIYPGNLRGWSTKFNAILSTISYYTVVGEKGYPLSGSEISKTYTININCPTLKGYEPIRLCWLNQWGVWDYYTFTMKSTRMLSTKGSTYQQLGGSWNDSVYRLDTFRGGKKAFRVNATEKITMNTDFVNESESEWFEELINSPEVYILEGYQDDIDDSALNQYVTPARLTTSSYTRKTVANDKLMQYTFEVEKSKTLRTQSI